MGVRERARVGAAGNEAGKVRHVDHELGADLVGDLAEAAEVDDARIGRAAGDDDFRPVLAREPGHLVHIDPLVFAAHAVGHRLEPAPGHVDRRAMGQVPAGREIEPHEGVAGRHQGHERGDVGGGAGMRLHVCKFTSEKLGNTFNRKVFCHIDILAAAVIAPPGQAFGIFVGENGALRLQDCLADDVFRGDQLDFIALAGELALDDIGNLGIGLGERGREQARRIGTGWRRIGH